jgi:hypothetical protein
MTLSGTVRGEDVAIASSIIRRIRLILPIGTRAVTACSPSIRLAQRNSPKARQRSTTPCNLAKRPPSVFAS